MTGATPDDGFELADPAVRDLAWLLLSPDLFDADKAGAPLARPVEDRAVTMDWLRALDNDPSNLHVAVKRTEFRRLGFYAEALIEYFLVHGPGARMIAGNVPLRSAGQTLGEVDFLVEDRHGARLHWELAVKFYLYVGSETDREPATLAHFVGPNLKDRLDLKHARLLQHQLKLSTRDEFASLGFGGGWQPELFVKGRLFYRDPPDRLAAEIAPDHVRGWWQTVSEFKVPMEGETCARLPRLDWFAGHPHGSESDAIDLTDLRQPIMVARYDRATGRERSRGFIVPDDWPELAARFTTT